MNRTAEQQKEEYQQIRGEELGLLFCKLSQELRSIYVYWQQFVELFGRGEKHVEILGRTAPRFFRITQQLLWTEALLGVSRLLAPVKSRSKPNLTIPRFSST